MNSSKKPPQDNKYKRAIFIDRIWNLLFCASIIVALLQNSYVGNRDIPFLEINGLVLIFLSLLEYFRGKNIYDGTIIKRKNLFDTTFRLKRIYNRVDEFYDNQDINDKMIKLFANNHESIFFTKQITSTMLIYQYIFISVIGVLLLVSIFHSGLTEINAVIMMMILSYFGIGRTLDIKTVNEESNKLFDESMRIVNNIEIDVSEINLVEMLEVIINYESLLSSMNFVLSDCIYRKKRQDLTEKWLEIKKNYGVYNASFSDLETNRCFLSV